MLLLRNSTLIESNEADPVLPQEPALTAVKGDLQHDQNNGGGLQCSGKMSLNPFRAAKPLEF